MHKTYVIMLNGLFMKCNEQIKLDNNMLENINHIHGQCTLSIF